MNTASHFPLVTLQPVVDFKNAWVALLLESESPLDAAAVTNLLATPGLAGLLDQLPCVMRADLAALEPALAAGMGGWNVILLLPVAEVTDPPKHPSLAALRNAGFGLMADGMPADDADLPDGFASLAVACPGHAMPAGMGDWLQRLPGPHLALGTTENICPGFCRFHWLAGHLAGQTAPSPTPGDPAARGLLMKLLSLVMADADADALGDLIRRDTNLSFHLLKLVNSVAFAPNRRIESFGQAITMLGRRQLQRWLQLLLYVRPKGSDTASPLLPRAAMRAGLMEGLAKRRGMTHEMLDHAFMAGMFSLLDLLFGKPLQEIIAPLGLANDVERALTQREGPLGGLLAAVVAGESGPTPSLAAALAATGIDATAWAEASIDGATWAAQVSKEA